MYLFIDTVLKVLENLQKCLFVNRALITNPQQVEAYDKAAYHLGGLREALEVIKRGL